MKEIDKIINNSKLIKRINEINQDIKECGLRIQNNRKCLTGYSYSEFYDWDLYFENLYMSYFGEFQYCRNGVEMFLDNQMHCGFVARTIILPRYRQHFKPFLAQISLLGSRQSGDYRWLDGKYYERLKKYLDHWFWFLDFDKNGLAVWESADHSGMDNQFRRAGYIGQMTVEGVDLNCYLVRELQSMAEIAKQLKKYDDAIAFKEHADKLSTLINETFWDDADGFFYDRDERTGELIKVKTVAAFIPLWIGIVPKDRAKRLIEEHLVNENEFWTSYPIAAWSKGEPDYYQERKANECNWMGTTWIPTNYMIFHGLIKYGYLDIAKELADKTFKMVMSEASTREYYNAETGNGQGLNPFWGWSALAYFMPLELELAYDPTDVLNKNIIPLGTKYLEINF